MRAALLSLALVVTACGSGGGEFTSFCAGLSLGDCRLTDGCKPDICAACFCDLSYRGCIAETATPGECPALGCPGALCCSTEAQCQGQGICTPPGAAQGCGPCSTELGDCTVDTECSGTMICQPIACSCNSAMKCVPGCVDDAGCAEQEGTKCDVGRHRCVAVPCSTDVQCPANFRCGGTTCERSSCTDDLECAGFCVLGKCYAGARGECRIPPA